MLPLIGTAEAPKVPPSPMPAAASADSMYRLILHTPSTAGCVAKHHSLARHGIDAGQCQKGRRNDETAARFIRKQGNYFRVVYERHYPNGVLEEVVLTQRFESEADAQRH